MLLTLSAFAIVSIFPLAVSPASAETLITETGPAMSFDSLADFFTAYGSSGESRLTGSAEAPRPLVSASGAVSAPPLNTTHITRVAPKPKRLSIPPIVRRSVAVAFRAAARPRNIATPIPPGTKHLAANHGYNQFPWG